MSHAIETITQFDQELEEDFKVDQISLMAKLEEVSQINRKWLMRYFQARQTLLNVTKRKDETYVNVMADKATNDLQYKSTDSASGKKKIIENSSEMRKIARLLADQEQIVDYLKGVVAICSFTFPKQTGNMVQLIDLESRS